MNENLSEKEIKQRFADALTSLCCASFMLKIEYQQYGETWGAVSGTAPTGSKFEAAFNISYPRYFYDWNVELCPDTQREQTSIKNR